MKNAILLIPFFIFFIKSFAQTNARESSKPAYDSVLATKLGADEYGMKKYVMAFLKSGKTKISDSTEAVKIQMAHLKNIMRLADEGKLIVAGPFLDNQNVRGIFIFNVENIDEAKRLTETDPAIKAGVLEMELRPWYGSAALIEAAKLHKKVEKKSVAE
ncbi:YciI family protein [Segetibacter koreensis]|uniref:YciI family protein n=1 Tax=Segetibacter koreensis TaxID=398037 RepID=UPI00037F5587|nr:YciI family protein [Segetibacter koreensis]